MVNVKINDSDLPLSLNLGNWRNHGTGRVVHLRATGRPATVIPAHFGRPRTVLFGGTPTLLKSMFVGSPFDGTKVS